MRYRSSAVHRHKRNSSQRKFVLDYNSVCQTVILAIVAVLAPSSFDSATAFGLLRPRMSREVLRMTTKNGKGGDVESTLLVSSSDKLGFTGTEGNSIRLILASQSPRRREILDMMGLTDRYTVNPSPLDEPALQRELAARPHLSPEDYAKTLAEQKAQALGLEMVTSASTAEHENTLILGSDTIVDLDGTILEKPVDENDAHAMLTKLSGNWHKVHTGVAIYGLGVPATATSDYQQPSLLTSFTATARVKFANLTPDDIKSYVNTGEPMDKAGSYGIQGVGGQLVEMIEGDYFCVMGLPMHRLSRELSRTITLLEAKSK